MYGVEGLVKLGRLGWWWVSEGWVWAVGWDLHPLGSPLGADLSVGRLPMMLASLGALVGLGVRGTRWRERVALCTPMGRFVHMCGAGSAERGVCAGGCMGARGGKAVYLALCDVPVCVRVYSPHKPAQCLHKGRRLEDQFLFPWACLKRGCVSARVFVSEQRLLPLSMCSSTALWCPRRGRTPGEALARARGTRQG